MKLRRQLAEIKEQRKLARETRLERKRYPVVAVVGYTNAGRNNWYQRWDSPYLIKVIWQEKLRL